MIEIDDALARICARVPQIKTESIPTGDAVGRVLAEPVVSSIDWPLWDNAAMDGYAVRSRDVASDRLRPQPDCDGGTRSTEGTELDIVGAIAAGDAPSVTVGEGQAARIFTGAPLPAGADTVVMQENTESLRSGTVRILGTAPPGQHVRRAGEVIRQGDEVVAAGRLLSAGDLAVIASVGQSRVVVTTPPVVAVIATGNELVACGQPLAAGQIWASNSIAMCALIEQAGGRAFDCGIARDDVGSTKAAFREAIDRGADVIVSTGGVSVGDFDVVKDAMTELGVSVDFWKVRMKPGKPLAFGTIGDTPIVGLPGNPVSCIVSFLQFVRPMLRIALGDPQPFLPVVDAVLEEPVRRRPGRPEFQRVGLEWRQGRIHARPVGEQGSANLQGLAKSDGFLLIDAQTESLRAGDVVPVQVHSTTFLAAARAGLRWAGGSRR